MKPDDSTSRAELTARTEATAADEGRHPVDSLAESFAERIRRGEEPTIEEYVAAHPQHAEMIRAVFPGVELVERAGRRASSSEVSHTRLGNAEDWLVPSGWSAPERLGDFRIVGELGRGGMGVVYEAIQQSLGRRVALKVIGPAGAGSERHRERFRREAEAVAALHHTNIVAVFGTGEDRGLQYYAMQLIDGVTLGEVVDCLRHPATALPRDSTRPESPSSSEALKSDAGDRSPTVDDEVTTGESLSGHRDRLRHAVQRLLGRPLARGKEASRGMDKPLNDDPIALDAAYDRNVARLIAEVADALQYAHRQGVLHRDIKPSNLMLDSEGTVWLTDFGLATREMSDRMTQTGELVGTLRYMAPEQLGGQFDAKGDVYCLGVTLYELLTLRPALTGSMAELLDAGRRSGFLPPRAVRRGIAADLETILLKACATEPAHRYASAGEFSDDLRRFLADRPIRARRVTPVERVWRWSRRNPVVASLSAATLLLLVTVAGLLAWMNREKQQDLEAIASQYNRAEQNLLEKTRALAEADRARSEAERERTRAETNLALAVEAFENIIDHIAARGGSESLLEDFEDLDLVADADVMLTDADVRLLGDLLAFFDRFAEENAADLRPQVAAAHKRVGDIQQRLGRLADAERSYAEALTTYRELARMQPDDPSLVLEQVAILNEQMRLAASRRRPGELRRSFELAESLLQENASVRESPEGRFALSKTLSLVASLESRAGPRERPRPRNPWLARLGPIGNRPPPPRRPGSRGRHAAEANARAIELLEGLLAEQPQSVPYRLALAHAHRDASRLPPPALEPQQAEQSQSEAVELLEQLAGEFPDSETFRFELADTLVGGPRRGPQDRDDLARAVEICEQLVERSPQSVSYQSLLAEAQVRLAAAEFATGSPQRALTMLRSAIDTRQSLVSRQPDVLLHRIALAQSLWNLAELELRLDHTEQAAEAFQRARGVIEDLPRGQRRAPIIDAFLGRLGERYRAAASSQRP